MPEIIHKTTIGILGTGGVGGYFGGLLQKHYSHDSRIKIAFLSRPPASDVIKKDGLTLITTEGVYHMDIADVYASGESVPHLDFLLVCTKNYDLHDAIHQFKNTISDDTIIIPLLNGVNAVHHLKEWFPKNTVAHGCVYLVAHVASPGTIKQTGDVHSVYFGIPQFQNPELKRLEKLMQKAGIDAHYSDLIEEIVWEKFIFISAVASLTTMLNKTIGEVKADPVLFKRLEKLVDEAITVAITAGIRVPLDIYEKTMKKISEMPDDATSSMHRDYYNDKPTEYKSLTEFLVHTGQEFDVEMPEFKSILNWFEKPGNLSV